MKTDLNQIEVAAMKEWVEFSHKEIPRLRAQVRGYRALCAQLGKRYTQSRNRIVSPKEINTRCLIMECNELKKDNATLRARIEKLEGRCCAECKWQGMDGCELSYFDEYGEWSLINEDPDTFHCSGFEEKETQDGTANRSD